METSRRWPGCPKRPASPRWASVSAATKNTTRLRFAQLVTPGRLRTETSVETELEDRMKSFQSVMGLVLVMGTTVAAGRALSGRPEQAATAGGMSSQATAAAFPKDVYADTGNRLPAIKREDLDDAGKKLFDARGTAGAFGPGPIRLYSQPVAEY